LTGNNSLRVRLNSFEVNLMLYRLGIIMAPSSEAADNPHRIALRLATVDDTGVILQFIGELAEYERLAHEVSATEEDIREALFGDRPYAEVIIAEHDGAVAGFALFFHNFSTFLGRPGIYLEDLYVRPEMRGRGIGKSLLAYLAGLAVERRCGRLEWSVLDWNAPSIAFYKSLGARPMEEWDVYRLTGDALHALAGRA
jgi:GNAT superfamily N-acetyltransferase